MDDREKIIYDNFKALGITDFKVTEHEPVYTSQEVVDKGLIFPGINPKNLFLRKKKTDRYYLVVKEHDDPADLKHFKEVADWGQVRFAHAEEMAEVLGVTPGAVTPLALLNDSEKRVTLVLSKDIVNAPDEEWINVHPLRNTATLSMHKGDLMKLIAFLGHEVIEEK